MKLINYYRMCITQEERSKHLQVKRENVGRGLIQQELSYKATTKGF